MAEELAHIDRAQADIRKFIDQQNKLAEEASNRRVVCYIAPIAVAVAVLGNAIAASSILLRSLGLC